MTGSPRLDRIDINILSTLQEQGNITNVALARSEEHTSELQSPVPISYAVFCLKKKKKTTQPPPTPPHTPPHPNSHTSYTYCLPKRQPTT